MSAPNFIKTTKDEIQFNVNTNTKTDASVIIAHGENHGFSNAAITFFKGNNTGNNYILKIDGDSSNKFEVKGDISSTDIKVSGSSIFALNNEYYENQNLNTGTVRYGSNSGVLGDSNTFIGFNAATNSIGLAVSNVIVGTNAGENTTRSNNTFVGVNTGRSNTLGSFNTYLGHQTGISGTVGSSNTMIGAGAGSNATTSANIRSVFVGVNAGANNTGQRNIFLGTEAGLSNTSGAQNVYIGDDAGKSNDSGGFNVFIGRLAGTSNTSGSSNTVIGYAAGLQTTTGINNTFIGRDAGRANTSGSDNVHIGVAANFSGQTDNSGTYIGAYAGSNIAIGEQNVMVGTAAGSNADVINNSVFIGNNAGENTTGADHNTFVGHNTGVNNVAGANNTYLGSSTGKNVNSGSNNVILGSKGGIADTNKTLQNSVIIGYGAEASVIGSNNIFQLQNGSNSLLMTGDFGNSNIGIGLDRTPLPEYKLEVNGSIALSGTLTFGDDISNTVVNSLDGTYDVGQYNVLQINCLTNGTKTLKTSRTYQVDFASNSDQVKICAAADSHITITNTGNYTGCELLLPYKGISNIAGKVFVWNAGTQNVVIRTFDPSGNTGTTDEYKLLPIKNSSAQTAVNSYTSSAATFQEFFPMASTVNSNDVKWLYIDRV